MTKLTDDELAELTATKVMGWHEEYGEYVNMGVSYWCNPKGQRCCTTGNWNPCNDWNDAMMCAKSLGVDEKKRLNTWLSFWLPGNCFGDLAPRRITEWTLKAAGVEL